MTGKQWEPPQTIIADCGRAITEDEKASFCISPQEWGERAMNAKQQHEAFARAAILASPLPECVAVLRYARLGLSLANQHAEEDLKGTGDESIFKLPLAAIDKLLARLEGKEPADEC